MFYHILHIVEMRAVCSGYLPLAHPYFFCDVFTGFHAISRLAKKSSSSSERFCENISSWNCPKPKPSLPMHGVRKRDFSATTSILSMRILNGTTGTKGVSMGGLDFECRKR